MEQSGLKDERVAHIAGSERPGERPRPRLLGVSPPSRCGPRTKWPRKSGQSSFLCDRKENSSSQETKQPNEFPAAPSRSLNLPKMRDDACDPSPIFCYKISDSLFTRCSAVLARSLFWSVVPWPASPSEARADISSALSGRLSCPFGVSSRWRSSSAAACAKAGVGGGVRAKAAGRCSHLLLPLRGGASSSAVAPSASGRRPVASSSSEALGKEAGLLELVSLLE